MKKYSKISFVVFILTLVALISCNHYVNDKSIIGNWKGEYQSYVYTLSIYDDLNYHLTLNETDTTAESGKIFQEDGKFKFKWKNNKKFIIRLDSINKTLKIIPEERAVDIEVFCLMDFKKST